MIAPRWRMVLRDLHLSWERTLLVIAAIAVGVFGVGAILTGFSIMMREIDSSYMGTNPASVRMWTDGVDEGLLTALRARPDVAIVESRRMLRASVRTGDGEWSAMPLYAPPSFENLRIDTFAPEEGAWPPKAGEVLIERSSIRVAKAAIGSWVTVRMPSGVERRLRVAGTVHSPALTPGSMALVAYGYVSRETLTLLGEERTSDEIKVVLRDSAADEASIRRAAFDLKQWLEQQGRTVSRVEVPNPGEHPNMPAMRLILNMMLSFAILSLLLSGLLVFNLVSGIIARQTRQIGVMKAVGATTAQVMGVYIGMVALLGLAGVTVAVPLATLAGQGIARTVLNGFNMTISRDDIPVWVSLVQFGVGVLVPVLAALYPAYSGSATTVLAALRDAVAGAAEFGTTRLDAVLARIAVLGRPFALALRNTFRRKGRLALTIVALSLGGAVFMTAMNVADSLTETINSSFDRRNYDIELQLARPYPQAALRQIVQGTPGVVKAEGWLQVDAEIVESPEATIRNGITIVGMPPQTPLADSPLMAGRQLAPGDAGVLVITPTLAEEEPAMKVGSRATLRIDDRESSWLVVGLVREVGSGMVAYAPYDHLEGVARSTGLTNNVKVVCERSDKAFVHSAEKAIRTQLERAGVQVASTQAVATSRQVLILHVAITLGFLMFVSVLSSIVGAMGLASTMSINVIERTREIGVMRAVGATTHAVLRIVVLEGVLISMVSWVVALVLSFPLSRLTGSVPAAVFIKAPLIQVVSTTGVWLWLAIAASVGIAASITPAWRASRIPVPETLAYE